MSFTVEKLEHSMAKLTITVPAADFDKAMTAAYNKTKNRFNVPGFRKGKVPMAFIEKMYGCCKCNDQRVLSKRGCSFRA